MTLASQWKKVTDNWLIIALIFLLLAVMNFGSITSIAQRSGNFAMESSMTAPYMAMRDSYGGSMPSPMPPYYTGTTAPDIAERKVTKNAYIATEVERGDFAAAEQQFYAVARTSNSIILSEQSQRYGDKRHEYYQGNYQLQVDTRTYDTVVAQLKALGTVQSANENTQDITGPYTNAQINLATEEARLVRYQALYADAKDVTEKLTLSDRIFEQERTVRYMKENMENMDEQVSYSTIQFTLTEKQSAYADIAIIKGSELVRNFVNSINSLVTLLVSVLPWALLALLGYGIWKFTRKH